MVFKQDFMGYAVTVGQPMLALDFRPQHSCYFLKNWDPWWPQGELIGLEVVAGSERDVLVLNNLPASLFSSEAVLRICGSLGTVNLHLKVF